MLRSIRGTLQLWHAGILAVALASFGAALYIGVSGARYRGVDAELEGAGRVVADRLRPPPRPLLPPRFRPGDGLRRPLGPLRGREPGAESLEFEPAAMPSEGDPRLDEFWSDEPRRDGARRPRRRPWQPGDREPRDFPGPPEQRSDRLADVPRDLLRRVGVDEADQPYFVIWRPNGPIALTSLSAPQTPIPPAPPGITVVSDQQQPPHTAPALFRQRGDLREVILAGPLNSRVLVGRSVRREKSELRQLLLILVAAGGAVMSVGLAGGWLLSARAVRPIRAISETARSISASDLSRRIDAGETDSELGSLARTLNEAFDRLEAAFQQQTRFTADASHELRTPLSVIHTHLELALTKDRSGDEYREAMAACMRASKRMKSLIESLLVLAHADAGRLNLVRESFDLKDVVEECAAMVAPLAAEKNVTVETELTSVPLSADRTRLSQVVTNLLGNAIAYHREAGSVRVTLAGRDGEALLTVADTGVGINEADQPHVFERFFRADKARSRAAGGSGLGLAICKSVVEAHGGTIAFNSRAGEGTTFTVRLPRGTAGAP